MIFNAYKLKFKSGFHTDSYGNGSYTRSESFIHSDTLSSAVLSLWALQYPDQIEAVAKAPPYLLSSAFPFYGSTFFLPLPEGKSLTNQNSFKALPDKESVFGKNLKKTKFVPSDLWEYLLKEPDSFLKIKTKTSSDDKKTDEVVSFVHSHSSKEYLLLSPSFLVPKNVFSNKPHSFETAYHQDFIFAEDEDMRVCVSRFDNQSQDGQLFAFRRTRYPYQSFSDKWSKNFQAGLYFLARFTNEEAQKTFEELLALLGDTGLGADKNCGAGLFEFKKVASPVKPVYGNNPASSVVTLSLFCPNKEEQKHNTWFGKESRYTLTARRGWIHNSSLRRKSICMFAEGSQFKNPSPGESLKGDMVDVSPEGGYLNHKVFRDGRGFFISF